MIYLYPCLCRAFVPVYYLSLYLVLLEMCYSESSLCLCVVSGRVVILCEFVVVCGPCRRAG